MQCVPAGDWTPAAEVWSAPACYLPSAARGQLTGAAAAEALLREVSEKKLTADRLWAEIISCSDEACEEVPFLCLSVGHPQPVLFVFLLKGNSCSLAALVIPSKRCDSSAECALLGSQTWL